MSRRESPGDGEVPGFDDVRRLYRDEGRLIEPPAAVDAAILAASRRALGRPVLGGGGAAPRRWRAPLAAAAVVVLATSLAMLFKEAAPPLREPDAPPGFGEGAVPATGSPGSADSAGSGSLPRLREVAKPGEGERSRRESAPLEPVRSPPREAGVDSPGDAGAEGAAPRTASGSRPTGGPDRREVAVPGSQPEPASAGIVPPAAAPGGTPGPVSAPMAAPAAAPGRAPGPASAEIAARVTAPVREFAVAPSREGTPGGSDGTDRRAISGKQALSDPGLAERAADSTDAGAVPSTPPAAARAARVPAPAPAAPAESGASRAGNSAGQPVAADADPPWARRLAEILRLWESGRRMEASRQLEELLREHPDLSLPPGYPVPRSALR